MSALAWVGAALLSAVLGAEIIAWSAPAHRWVLRWAVRALPSTHRDRYLEEWLGELDTLPDGPLTRLLFVLSIAAKRRGMAASLGATPRGVRAKTRTLVDAIAAATMIVVLAPCLAAIALAARLEGGPGVLYGVQRRNRDGRSFMLLRFRCIRPIEFTQSQNSWEFPLQYRLGPVGRILRETSLDELPQLINVVRGEVSLAELLNISRR